MKIRILGAIAAIAIFVPFIIAGGAWFAYFALILGVIGVYELAVMKGIDFHSSIGVIASIAVASILLPANYLNKFLPIDSSEFIFYICGIILLTMTVYKHKTFNFVDAAVLMFGALYIGFGFRFLITMRDMGLGTLMYQLLVIWSTDTGAYFTGRFFGKTPLAPEVSPNKTVEGSVGGVVLALIVSSVYIYFFQPAVGQVNHIWLLTIIMSIVGQYGDLVESAYKRYFGVKDSGKLIPGHGGVLDRFDSMIFASFTFMIWLNLF